MKKRRSGRKKWLVVLTLCGVLAILFVASVCFQFRNASHDAAVREAFSELIAWRVEELGERQGIITLPVETDAWQNHSLGEYFAPFINQLEPGEYSFVVTGVGDDLKFRVTNEASIEIIRGFVPKRPFTFDKQ